jgi:hypothetical protein
MTIISMSTTLKKITDPYKYHFACGCPQPNKDPSWSFQLVAHEIDFDSNAANCNFNLALYVIALCVWRDPESKLKAAQHFSWSPEIKCRYNEFVSWLAEEPSNAFWNLVNLALWWANRARKGKFKPVAV